LPKIEKKSDCFSGRRRTGLFGRVEREVWAGSLLVLNVQNQNVGGLCIKLFWPSLF
jgi:hypothetical protein